MPGTDFVSQITDVDIKWKVSVAMSSSEVRNLHTPMVTMILTTTSENGEKQSRSIEMTLAQFRDFSSNFHQIHAQMEQLKFASV